MTKPTHADYALLALTLWREDRSGGSNGMLAVACVIRNRAKRDNHSYFAECCARWQFSSLTAPGDPELILYPADTDSDWLTAQSIAETVIGGYSVDITVGATSYYALSMQTPPSWAAKMTHTITIGGQTFFK